jgi:hypothetical protein
MFQEKVLKQAPQKNESAVEQQKDEAISDAIRNQYQKATGKEFPIADKNRLLEMEKGVWSREAGGLQVYGWFTHSTIIL